MTHADEGMIVSLRDELPAGAPAYAHLHACSACVAALADATSRSTSIADALATLDRPIDMAAAKAATRARLDRARPAHATPTWRRWPLGRAAMILLATAGAASALTWSPLREWLAPAEPTSAPTPAVTSEPALELAETSAIAVEVLGGRIAVIIRGAAAGTAIEVVWGEGLSARVEGPRGSGFTYGDGRLEVDAAAGALRVELPRAVGSAVVEIDGQVYLERSDGRVDLAVAAVERTDDLVRFVVPTP
jgi:hypothetical protein